MHHAHRLQRLLRLPLPVNDGPRQTVDIDLPLRNTTAQSRLSDAAGQFHALLRGPRDAVLVHSHADYTRAVFLNQGQDAMHDLRLGIH